MGLFLRAGSRSLTRKEQSCSTHFSLCLAFGLTMHMVGMQVQSAVQLQEVNLPAWLGFPSIETTAPSITIDFFTLSEN